MSLRLKLLLSFALGELLLLLFFGSIAYDTAKLTNLKNEVGLLSSVTPRIAEDVANNVKEGGSWNSTLLPDSQGNEEATIFLFVSDQHGNLVSWSGEPAYKEIFQTLDRHILQTHESRSGSHLVNKSTYVWARADVPSYNYRVTLVRQAHVSQANAFFREMGVSLIVSCLAIFSNLLVDMLYCVIDPRVKYE